MTLDSSVMHQALLEHNYFPAQRKKQEEMPPVFTSNSFNVAAAKQLLEMKPKPKTKGFDLIEYRATKFNSVSRSYAIPHPVGYSQLAHCIASNWAQIEPFQKSHVSMIRPRKHKDGRIIIMDYETFPRRAARMRSLAFGKRYVARSDITSCFPSVYTHAIPWAAVGITAAKAATSGGWYNDLDFHARRTVRDETQGLPVGPATSNVIAEIILGQVDKALEGEFSFVRGASLNGMSRFIDDYTFYCDSFDEAERFIRRLEEELNKFKLRLNPKKTSITNAPSPFADPWTVELSLRIPFGSAVNSYRAINFIDFASSLSLRFPEGSVLKYAANALISCPLDHYAKQATLDYLLVLAVQHPVLLPLLEPLFDATLLISGQVRFADRILAILKDCATRKRSDGMAWSLYYLAKYKVEITSVLAEVVLNSKDCIAILMLHTTYQHTEKIVAWVYALDKSDAYELDRYWLLLYQLYLEGHVGPDYCSVPDAFIAMQTEKVTFLK